jgi:hypothetical protein
MRSVAVLAFLRQLLTDSSQLRAWLPMNEASLP